MTLTQQIRNLYRTLHLWWYTHFVKNGVVHVTDQVPFSAAYDRVAKGGYIMVPPEIKNKSNPTT